MVGLRLERLAVTGVCPSLTLDVPAGDVRAAIVHDQESVRALANVVVGLEEPRHGRVLVDDSEVGGQHADHRRRRRHPNVPRRRHGHCPVRLVPATGGLIRELTVFENILNARCPTARTSRELATVMAHETAASLGMPGLLDRYPEHVSPRERRLAGLALAVCWEPMAVVLEDAPGLPSWDVVLDAPGSRPHDGRDTPQDPPAGSPRGRPGPSALDDVAVLLITTDPARAWQLDDDPVGVEPRDAGAAAPGDDRPGTPGSGTPRA